ncbi:MAG: NAD(P)-binding protein [Candidatus Woesearchaeota archaeon]
MKKEAITKLTETIIIGAGVSGLGAARTLHENGRKFKIITEDIGGRILTSKDGQVNYGAYYVGMDYTNISKFVKKTRILAPLGVEFHKRKERYSLLSFSFIFNIGECLKLMRLLYEFRDHYKKFKKNCINMSQKQAINSDKYLKKLYHQKASVFIREHGIENIIDNFLGEVIYGTTFSKIEELYTFEFLHFSLYAFLPVHEFIFQKKAIIKGFERNIILDSVISMEKEGMNYKIITSKKKYLAKNVIVATPIPVSQKLLDIKKIKKPVSANMFHISGEIKKKWDNGEEEIFHQGSKTLAIARQRDGTYLFYSKDLKPNIKKYFSSFKIIKTKYWNPAFNLNGHILLEQKQGNNLYLATDHNVCGMEDSYITGIYAANQIIKNSK